MGQRLKKKRKFNHPACYGLCSSSVDRRETGICHNGCNPVPLISRTSSCPQAERLLTHPLQLSFWHLVYISSGSTEDVFEMQPPDILYAQWNPNVLTDEGQTGNKFLLKRFLRVTVETFFFFFPQVCFFPHKHLLLFSKINQPGARSEDITGLLTSSQPDGVFWNKIRLQFNTLK